MFRKKVCLANLKTYVIYWNSKNYPSGLIPNQAQFHFLNYPKVQGRSLKGRTNKETINVGNGFPKVVLINYSLKIKVNFKIIGGIVVENFNTYHL